MSPIRIGGQPEVRAAGQPGVFRRAGGTLAHKVGEVLGRLSLGPGPQVLACDIPGALTGTGKAQIVLDHPDAARACDVGSTKDERTLALAVKRLKVKRYLELRAGRQPLIVACRIEVPVEIHAAGSPAPSVNSGARCFGQ